MDCLPTRGQLDHGPCRAPRQERKATAWALEPRRLRKQCARGNWSRRETESWLFIVSRGWQKCRQCRTINPLSVFFPPLWLFHERGQRRIKWSFCSLTSVYRIFFFFLPRLVTFKSWLTTLEPLSEFVCNEAWIVYLPFVLRLGSCTVRWSNFDRRVPKMGPFLQSTDATPPADIFLNESLRQKPPCGHHVHDRHGHSFPVKNRFRFSKFHRNTKLWPSLWKSVSRKKMCVKSSHWSCL